MRAWIKRYLGITELNNTTHSWLSHISDDISRYRDETKKLRNQVEVSMVGIGRIIAKLEPSFPVSEFDEQRRAESDKLGQQVIERLTAESLACHHQFGDE